MVVRNWPPLAGAFFVPPGPWTEICGPKSRGATGVSGTLEPKPFRLLTTAQEPIGGISAYDMKKGCTAGAILNLRNWPVNTSLKPGCWSTCLRSISAYENGPVRAVSRCAVPAGNLGSAGVQARWPIAMGSATTLLMTLPIWIESGTAQPVGAFAGTVKMIWSSPMQQPRPWYAAVTDTPPSQIVNGTFGMLTPRPSPAASFPLMGPRPVAQTVRTSPGLAAPQVVYGPPQLAPRTADTRE